uniref:Ig-like domain-containing protein n=1 Tax=Tetraodon nigroviridis TaxID=99883 RepID=H3BYZ8_TETNG
INCFFVFVWLVAQTATTEFSPSMIWKSSFILVKPGQNLTLSCLYRDTLYTRISWFKESREGNPTLICVYDISSQSQAFFNDFKSNQRFNLHPHSKGVNLTITDLKLSDSAIYYCAKRYFYAFDFTEAYNIIVEGSEMTINQSASESIPSGGSVTLNCSVQTGTCDGDHTVYWFRDSGPSQLGLINNHKGSKNQCEKKTNTCFYSLSLKKLNISQTGTYYCAVAACGRILFGNGTKLDFEEKGNLLVWVYFLSAAWIFTIIVAVLLFISILMMKKKNSLHLLVARVTKEEDRLHYAAVRGNDNNRTRRQRNRQNDSVYSECVYSG